jgi:hypothetical protein
MKNIYGGGAQTNINGLKFEQETNLNDVLVNMGFTISPDTNIPKNKKNNKNIPQNVFHDSELIGQTFSKKALYIFLESQGINADLILSKKLEPDDSLLINKNNTIYIIEKKFQNTTGTADEKLQTCEFKKNQYQKLFKSLNIEVKYIYVLNDWFKKPAYKDVLDFILEKGCYYYFNEIPLDIFNKE